MTGKNSEAARQTWREKITFYEDFVQEKGGDFLQPLLHLVRNIAASEYAKATYASTSHAWLCISLLPDYNPDYPFLAVNVDNKGNFKFEFWRKVGHQIKTHSCPASGAYTLFESMLLPLEQETNNKALSS